MCFTPKRSTLVFADGGSKPQQTLKSLLIYYTIIYYNYNTSWICTYIHTHICNICYTTFHIVTADGMHHIASRCISLGCVASHHITSHHITKAVDMFKDVYMHQELMCAECQAELESGSPYVQISVWRFFSIPVPKLDALFFQSFGTCPTLVKAPKTVAKIYHWSFTATKRAGHVRISALCA